MGPCGPLDAPHHTWPQVFIVLVYFTVLASALNTSILCLADVLLDDVATVHHQAVIGL